MYGGITCNYLPVCNFITVDVTGLTTCFLKIFIRY